MAKANAYSLFVSDIAKRRKEAGSKFVNIGSLYKELDQEWRDLPEGTKQKYKDRAKRINDNRLNDTSTIKTHDSSGTRHQVNQNDRSNSQDIASNPLPITFGGCDTDVKNNKPFVSRDDVNSRPNKRPHEDDSLALVDLSSIQQNKKLKPGIPNWKNIADKGAVDPIRYLDKHLFDLRKQCEDIIVSRGHRMISIPIYTISINVLCKQKISTEPTYVPLEICINPYSLKKGKLCEPYHVIIDAGDVPTNCLNEALDHSTMHKITFPPNPKGYPEGARKDYKKIYKEMVNFVRHGERTILVQDSRHLSQVQASLEWLHKKASEGPGTSPPGISTWTILPIVEFVASMFNWANLSLRIYSAPFFALHYMLKESLESSILDYNTALMCNYHAEDDNNTQWCAKNCAQKMIMNIENILNHVAELYTTCSDRQLQDRLPMITDLSLYRDNELIASSVAPSIPPIAAPPEQNELELSVPHEEQSDVIMSLPSSSTTSSEPTIQKSSVAATLDPRLTRIREKQTDDNNEAMETETEQEKRQLASKKKSTEQLIVASSGRVYDQPPDIF